MIIDTCVVYRWLKGTFDKPELIQGEVTVSVVSIWEMHIKNRQGKLPLPSQNLTELLMDYGFKLLPVSAWHAQTISTLPDYHKDPFDRMIIAQAINERLKVATYDRVFSQYLPDCLIC